MQMIGQERQTVEGLERQLLLFKKVVNASGNFIVAIQNDLARFNVQTESASLCRQDIFSILLDAEASIAVIRGILTQAGHGPSSGIPISYVV